MSNFYKPTFLHVDFPDGSSHDNPAVNFDKIAFIRIYDVKDSKDNYSYRIYFEGDKRQPVWMYPTKNQRDYEYERILSNFSSVGTKEGYENYLERVSKEKEILEDYEEIDEDFLEDVFIYRDNDGDFFVTKNEYEVKAKDIRYEKGKLLCGKDY